MEEARYSLTGLTEQIDRDILNVQERRASLQSSYLRSSRSCVVRKVRHKIARKEISKDSSMSLEEPSLSAPTQL
jgi:hypothetical protein